MISEPAGTRGTTTKRDGWADVLNALEDGQGDGIVVRELERLSRDVLVQEQLMRDVWGQGKEVLSTAPSEADLRDDPRTDPAAHRHNHRGGPRPQPGDDRAADATRRAAQAAARRLPRGTTRYGYHPVDKELIPDQAEQAVARRIRRLHRAGLSIRKIADQLNAEQVPAKRGGAWHPTTVAGVLRRIP